MADENSCILSVIVPVYNEAEVLPEFHRRLDKVLTGLSLSYEILYVDDGSEDETLKTIKNFNSGFVIIIELSRNFGKEIAMTAGLDHASGDAVVIIDADLQDPPELIPDLVERWQAGYDVVYAQRSHRDGDPFFKKLTASLFYRLMQGVGRVKVPENTGDFRLLSRRAVEALKQLRETHRFMKGLFTWIGFRQVAVEYRRKPRYAGRTKWDYWKLWNFALEGLTSFTITPLKIATYMGLMTSAGSFAYALIIIYKTLMYGEPVRGYPSLMVVILFLGGVQLMSLGIIGEYLGRMFNETKQRPLYFISRIVTPQSANQSDEPEQTG